MSTEARLDALLKAVKRLEAAHVEFMRAAASMAQPRLNKAGTRYAAAKVALFALTRERDQAEGPAPESAAS